MPAGRGRHFKKRFIRSLGVLVGLLGVILILSLLKAPELVTEDSHGALTSRTPASLDESGDPRADGRSIRRNAKAVSTGSLEINCQKSSYDILPTSRVRIRGTFCGNDRSPLDPSSVQSTKILNETSGAEATVFASKTARFSTDFILLRPGVNYFKIHHSLSDGQTATRSFTVQMP